MAIEWMLAAAVAVAQVGGLKVQEKSGGTPELPAVKMCSGGAAVRAEEECPPLIHSSRVDPGIRADLRIVLACTRPPELATELIMEERLYSAGFDVVNLRRLAPEIGETFSRALTIRAIGRGRMIWLTGGPTYHEPGTPFFVHISLFSRPPSERDPQLAMRLHMLAGEIEPRSCRIVKVERSTNSPASAWTYDNLAFLTRHYIEKAEREAPNSTSYRVH